MQNELNSQIMKISSQLKVIKEDIEDTNDLDPSNLEWDRFLKKATIVAYHFQEAISEIKPELKHFFACPKQYDQNAPQFLSNIDIPEIISEETISKQRYLEKINENGLRFNTANERENILYDQIHDHNLFCEKALKMIKEIIKNKNLDEKFTDYKTITRNTNNEFGTLEAMIRDTNHLLPPKPISNDF